MPSKEKETPQLQPPIAIKEYDCLATVEFTGLLNFDFNSVRKAELDAIKRRNNTLLDKQQREEQEALLAKERKKTPSSSIKRPSSKGKKSPSSSSSRKNQVNSDATAEELAQEQIELQKRQEEEKQRELDLIELKKQEEEILSETLWSTSYIFCYLNTDAKESNPLKYVQVVANKFRVVTQHRVAITSTSDIKLFQSKMFQPFLAKYRSVVPLPNSPNVLKKKSTSAKTSSAPSQAGQTEPHLELRKAIANDMKIDIDSIEILGTFEPIPLLNILIGKGSAARTYNSHSLFSTLRVRYSLDQPLVDLSVQKKLFPMSVRIPWIKNLPNESWLPEHCKSFFLTCEFLGNSLLTEQQAHAKDIAIDFSTLLYIEDVDRYRNVLETEPISLIIHDRDPKVWNQTVYVGRADFWLNSLLNEDTKSVSLVSSVYQYEIEVPIPVSTETVKKKTPSKSASSKRKGGARPKEEITEIESPPIAPVVIPRGRYEECLTEVKLVIEMSNSFPPIEHDKRIYPIVMITDYENIELVEIIENCFRTYAPHVDPEQIDQTQGRPKSSRSKQLSARRSTSPSSSRPTSRSASRATLTETSQVVWSPSSIFCCVEVCDGVHRIFLIESNETGSKHVIEYMNSRIPEEHVTKIIYDPTQYFCSSRVRQFIDPVTSAQLKKSKSEESIKRGKSRSESPVLPTPELTEPKNLVSRIRLTKALNDIVLEDNIYKLKRNRDWYVAAVKLLSTLSVDHMKTIMENRFIPTAPMLEDLKTHFSDATLIESDYSEIEERRETRIRQLRIQEEERLKTLAPPPKKTTINVVKDYSDFLGCTVTITGIPIRDPPPFLHSLSSLLVEGTEERIAQTYQTLKWDYPDLRKSDLVEQLIWSYIPNLSGYMVLIFPPYYKDLPPNNLANQVSGTIVRAKILSHQKKIFPFPTESMNSVEHTESEYVFCIQVLSWSQCADKTIDTRISGKYLRSRNPALQRRRDFVHDNRAGIIETKLGQSTYPIRKVPRKRNPDHFYIFDRSTGQLGGKQPLHTIKIEPLRAEEKVDNHLFVTRVDRE